MTPAEQAVVDVALGRGWIQPGALAALRASAAPGQLLPALRAHLPPAALNELRQVYEAAQRRGGTQAATRGEREAATLAAVSDGQATLVPPSRGGPSGGGGLRADLQPGDSIGGYWIERELARGGMGVVYVARDPSGRAVALKLLQSELAGPELLARFAAEAEVTARLSHPNVVGVHASGEHLGRAWYAMELVEGESLGDRLRREGALEPRAAAALTQVLAEALAHVHARGVLHRDLKPDNVLLAAPEGRPVLTDFGVARRSYAEERLTSTGEMVGTPSYMPPEQAAGELERIGPASDVYALGATLYAALTGEPPFGKQQQGLAVIKKVLHDDPPPPSSRREGIPRDLDAIVLTCLAKEPDQRYADAAALGDDLGRFVAGRDVIARVPGWRERWGRALRRRPLVARALGVALGLGLALGALGAGNELYKRYQRRAAEDLAAEEREARKRKQLQILDRTSATRVLEGARKAFAAAGRDVEGAQVELAKHAPRAKAPDESAAQRQARRREEEAYRERGAEVLVLLGARATSLAAELEALRARRIPPELEQRLAKIEQAGAAALREARGARARLGAELVLAGSDRDLARIEGALADLAAWAEVEPAAEALPRWQAELGLLRAKALLRQFEGEPPPAEALAELLEVVRWARTQAEAWSERAARDPAPQWRLADLYGTELSALLSRRRELAVEPVDLELEGAARTLVEQRAEALVSAYQRSRALTGGAAGEARRVAWDDCLELCKRAQRALFDARRFKRCLALAEEHVRISGRLLLEKIRPPGVDGAFQSAGRSLLRLGDVEQAEGYFQRWLDMKQAADTPESVACAWLARCARLRGRGPRARELLAQARAMLEVEQRIESSGEWGEGAERLVSEWILLTLGEGASAEEQARAAWEALPGATPERTRHFTRGLRRALTLLREQPRASAALDAAAARYLSGAESPR